MTICIVGNSHVIALKEAADGFPWALSYFCAPGFNLADVIVQDGKLVGGSERLRTALANWSAIGVGNILQEVELKASSAFIVVGLGLSPMHLASSYASVRLFNHMSRGMTMVSLDCLEEILVARFRSTWSFKIARLLRANSDRPIVVVPQPALIETPKTAVSQGAQKRRRRSRWQVLDDMNVGDMLFPLYERALAKAADYESVIAVPQPATTMTGVRTKAEYQCKPDDYRHANKSYGAHMLGRLKSTLETIRL
ncbi:hypothetical protein [Reyranella sp.]|uniref:hypothetical protein n=1 Tax=Reyranella sp. TaxID=1929291 RepID=UPI003D0F9D3F